MINLWNFLIEKQLISALSTEIAMNNKILNRIVLNSPCGFSFGLEENSILLGNKGSRAGKMPGKRVKRAIYANHHNLKLAKQ
jgi:hypothetical protein